MTLAPMKVARSEHAAVVLGDRLIVLGGLFSVNPFRTEGTPSVEEYDFGSDTWADLPPLPEARHHGMAAVVDDRLFFFGGYRLHGFDEVPDSWELVGDRWESRAPIPSPVGAGAAAVVDGMIYLVGGTPLGSTYRYDPEANTWEQLSSPRVLREHLAAVEYGGKVWAIGGRWNGLAFDSVGIYDPITDEWTDGPKMSLRRSGFGAAVVGDRVIVAGGETFEPLVALDSVEVYFPGTGAWSASTPLPVGLHGNPMAGFDGSAFMPGGSLRPAGVDNDPTLFSFQEPDG